MAKSLGGLAALADYGGSSSEESEAEPEVQTFVNDKLDTFIKEGILSNIVKESVRRVEYAKSISYRNHETIEIDDSSSESSDDESSESDSNSNKSDTDDDYLNLDGQDPTKLHTVKPQRRRKPPPKVKGEILLSELPPIEDLHISVPAYECIKMGFVKEVCDEMVVVQADANSAALDLDSILFLENGQRPLGRIFDVMGPVNQPFYCVRFNSKEHILEKNISKGTPIFFAPRTEHTAFIFLAELMKMKGSDASWENDHEPKNVAHMDFSDDEAERIAKGKGKKRAYKPPTGQDRSNNAFFRPPPGQDRRNNTFSRPPPGHDGSNNSFSRPPPGQDGSNNDFSRPPPSQDGSNTAFYRRERHYNPRNYGPIHWNSVHTQHMQ